MSFTTPQFVSVSMMPLIAMMRAILNNRTKRSERIKGKLAITGFLPRFISSKSATKGTVEMKSSANHPFK